MAGIAASFATTVFAAGARLIDVPLRVAGEAIPLVGFAQLTLIAALLGTILAVVLLRRANRPRHTFLMVTVVLTGVSFLPDVLADAPTATKVALALSHVVVAAMVIPALAARLTD